MGEERMKITLSSPGLHVVVGEQVNARRGGSKGRPQGSPPLHSAAPALTMHERDGFANDICMWLYCANWRGS